VGELATVNDIVMLDDGKCRLIDVKEILDFDLSPA
jgi:hypothetical protein